MENMDQMGALAELQEGLSTMTSEYQTFHNGLVDYTDGVSELASSYQDLDAGIQELSDGTSSLDSGASELKNGTEELQEQTSDLPGQMQSEVDEMMDEYDYSDFEPQSFVSDKNEKVDVVQFVLQTEAIEIEKPETTEETQEEEKGFWDRFLDLFR
jgi:X-X-X-Leu-X-X-Gly heptad repeat protein